MTAPSNPAEVGAFDPRSEAAYYGSIWQLPTNRIRELEEAFVRAQRSSLPPEAPSLTSSEQLAHTGQSRPLADREMSASPPIGEPVAWQWRPKNGGNWHLMHESATAADFNRGICEYRPLYASPPIGDTGGVEMLVPARVEAVDGWQPIETAPKDGTYIIAYPVLSETACVVVWERAVETPPMMRAKGENIDHSGYWRLPMTGKPTPYQPTHWRTLPAPPALQANPS